MLLYLIPLTSQKFFCTPVVRDHRCLAPAPSALQAPGCLCRSLQSLHSALFQDLPPSPQHLSAGLWFAITAAFHLLPQRFKPAAGFAAPLLPWVPSAGIMFNCFLIGTLTRYSFMFWGIWMGFCVMLYLVYGELVAHSLCRGQGSEQ